MTAVSTGDAEAVHCLLSQYWDRIFVFLCGWLGDREEAMDITQEVFFRIWRKADQYDDRFPLTPWIYRVASNLCSDHFRRKNSLVHSNRVDWEETHSETGMGQRSPEQIALQREMLEKALDALDSLPPRQRKVLRLRLLHEYRLREIAESQGISVGTVKSTLHSGLCRVRKRLNST